MVDGRLIAAVACPEVASDHADTLGAAVKTVAPLLREHGFRKQGNTFNREPEHGLVQVLAFQLGTEHPAELRGRFTVNLGLWFEESAALDPWRARGRFVHASSALLSQRLGFLLDEPADTWWRVDIPDALLHTLVRELVVEHALPFLDRLATRAAILAAWHAGDPSVSKNTVAPFTIAALHAARGEKAEAEAILTRELRELGPRHPKVASILEGAAAMGLDVHA
jgi:hypothetical protein